MSGMALDSATITGSFLSEPAWMKASKSLAEPPWMKTMENLANPPWTKAFENLAEPPWMKASKSLAEPPWMKAMENLAEPPWAKAMTSLAEAPWIKTLENLASPPWKRAFEGLAEPAWMKAFEHLAEPPWVKTLESFAEPAWSKALSEQFTRQQGLFDGLLEAPSFLTVRAGWAGDLPKGLREQLAAYRDELVVEAATQAEATVESEVAQAETLSRLAIERQAILICLKRILMIAEGVKLAETAPVVLMLLAFVLFGEVADEILREREEQSQ
jgi:hypothetical protein